VAFQSEDNKQGRSAALEADEAEAVREALREGQDLSYRAYRALIDKGIARELARINLPLSLYTEWYWQIDLHNLFHFLELRLDPHAQKEIRLYAGLLFELARKVAPRCCESFQRHVAGGVRFSRDEFAELKRRLSGSAEGAAAEDGGNGAEGGGRGAARGCGVEPLSGKALERFEEKLKSGRQK
jgi:thymidylate synthase (FAD)